MYSVSIACPAYNESEGIYDLVKSWIDYLEDKAEISEYEICIANDGSSDNTLAILELLSKKFQAVKVINLGRNYGAAYALSKAIKKCRMELVFLIDSDGQYRIDNLGLMIAMLDNCKADAVVGYRAAKHDTYLMKLGSNLSNILCNFIYSKNFYDFNCALKLIKKKIISNIKIEAVGLNYSADVLAKLIEINANIEQIEVKHIKRAKGVSSARFFVDARKRLLFTLYLWYKNYLKKIRVIH
jgi:glycosyltransferase involved in cell wall biosynthesis